MRLCIEVSVEIFIHQRGSCLSSCGCTITAVHRQVTLRRHVSRECDAHRLELREAIADRQCRWGIKRLATCRRWLESLFSCTGGAGADDWIRPDMSRRKQLWYWRLRHPPELGQRSVLLLSTKCSENCRRLLRRARYHREQRYGDDRNGIFICFPTSSKLTTVFVLVPGLAQAGLVLAALIQACHSAPLLTPLHAGGLRFGGCARSRS